jgi:hypothetical protein
MTDGRLNVVDKFKMNYSDSQVLISIILLNKILSIDEVISQSRFESFELCFDISIDLNNFLH